MEEDIEIIKCAEEYACELKPKSKREYKKFVNAYIVGAEEMRKRYDRQISELTEALDASHIFCEGVRDAIIAKACKWLSSQCVGDDTYVFTEYEFVEAMQKK